MTVIVKCPNGHKLKTKESHAARTIACPACGEKVHVPTSPRRSDAATAGRVESQSDPLESDFSDVSDSFGSDEYHDPYSGQAQLPPRTTTKTKATEPAPKSTADNRRTILLIGSAAVGSTLAMLVLFITWLLFGRDADPIHNRPAVAGTESRPDENTELKESRPTPARSPELKAHEVKNVTQKLRQIGLAFHNFADVNGSVFAHGYADGSVDPSARKSSGLQPTQLSWRVHLLPFLDQKPLYEQFHLDEAWDSPHNKSLLELMPEIYRFASTDEATTQFQVITGPEMMFGNVQPPAMRLITDGMRHTILALLSGPDKAVFWTKPDELTLDPGEPFAALGALPGGSVYCVMADGKAIGLPSDIQPNEFLALCTPHGNEIVDGDKYSRQFDERRPDSPLKLLAGLASSAPKSGRQPPAPEMIRMNTLKKERTEKLNNLVSGMHNYQDTYQQLPVAQQQQMDFAADGTPHLSWRVHLLPFLQQQPLFDQFKRDQPWDSPHNLTLLDKMPDAFRDPQDSPGSSNTRYVRFTGPDTPFDSPKSVNSNRFQDGTANTLVVVTAGADKMVPWTKPDDLVFDSNAPIICLGELEDDMFFLATANGGVRAFKTTLPPEWLKAFVTPAGSEKIPKNIDVHEIPL